MVALHYRTVVINELLAINERVAYIMNNIIISHMYRPYSTLYKYTLNVPIGLGGVCATPHKPTVCGVAGFG